MTIAQDAIFSGGSRETVIEVIIGKIRGTLQAWRERRDELKAISDLRSVGGHVLRDIGIDRSEVASMVIHGRHGR